MLSRTRNLRVTLMLLLALVAVCYLAWRWVTLPEFHPLLPSCWWWMSFFVVEGVALTFELWGYLLFLKEPPDRSAEADECQDRLHMKSAFPSVDVFITVCGEPLALVQDTIDDALRMSGHYSGDVRIYVLDDFEPPAEADLPLALDLACQQRQGMGLPVYYINRKLDERADKSASKGGNLQHGFLCTEPLRPQSEINSLKVASGKYILMLDADGRVANSILNRMVGLLECGDRMYGVVQAPQVYRNADPIAHALLAPGHCTDEQTFFMRHVQRYRDAWGAPFSVGSGCLVRRSALREIGGFPRSTITEDMELSFRLLEAGYRTVWLDEVLAYSTAPVNVTEFLKQRIRWCIGTLQHLGLPHGPVRGSFSFMHRLLYADGALYWLSFLLLPLMLVAPAVYLWTGASAIPVESDAVVPIVFGRVFLRAAVMWSVSAGTLPPVVTTIWKSVVSFHIALAWLKALLWGTSHPFKITRKTPNQGGITFHWGVLAPSAAILLLTVGGCAWYLLDNSPAPALRLFDCLWTLWAMLICLLNCLVCIELPRAEDDEVRCSYVEHSSIHHLLRGMIVRLFADPLNVPSLHAARANQAAPSEKSRTVPLE